MAGWSDDFKKGFFIGAGVIAAAVVLGKLTSII